MTHQVINHAYKGNYLGQLLLSFQTQKKEAGLSFSQKKIHKIMGQKLTQAE